MRRNTNHRSALFYAVVAAIIGSAGYLTFELGRYQGGYSLLDQRREQESFQQLIREQAAEAEELRRQITVLQMSQEIDRETYAQVESDLSQLQQRIQAQEEELAFYQGIISPEDGNAGLRVQNFAVTAAELDRHYLLRLVLVQTISHDRRVSGTVRLIVEGTREGEVAALSPGEVLPDEESGDIPFGFRYFQGLQREIVLPANFEPTQVSVEIWPEGSGGQRILHNYEWTVVAG
jgi:hypothetical protein